MAREVWLGARPNKEGKDQGASAQSLGWGPRTKAGETGAPHPTHIPPDLFSARTQETMALTSWTSCQVG